jgi:hypothetical protein
VDCLEAEADETTTTALKNTTIHIFDSWKTLQLRYLNGAQNTQYLCRYTDYATGYTTDKRWFDKNGDIQTGSMISEDVVSDGKTERA